MHLNVCISICHEFIPQVFSHLHLSSPALIQKSGFEEKVTNNITKILINTW